MFKLYDGRNELYQWDLNRKVIVEDPEVTEVHFCNKTDDCSLVVQVKDGMADIPNILLQDTWNIRVYAYCDEYTKVEESFKIKPRTKPSDYVYTETEIFQYSSVDKRMTELENNIDGKVETAVSNYLEENPIEVDLTPYAKKEDIPVKISELENDKGYLTQHQDISGKADKAHTHSIKDVTDYVAPDLSPYALKSDIPAPIDTYTKQELNNKFANTAAKNHTHRMSEITDYVAPVIPSLEGYATEQYVDDAIANIDIPEGDTTAPIFYLDIGGWITYDEKALENMGGQYGLYAIEVCEYVASHYPCNCSIYMDDNGGTTYYPATLKRDTNPTVGSFSLMIDYCDMQKVATNDTISTYEVLFKKKSGKWYVNVLEYTHKETTIATKEYVDGLFAGIATAEGGSY